MTKFWEPPYPESPCFWVNEMLFASEKLSFDREGRLWPHRDKSRFVSVNGVRWHVQEMGDGRETVILIHGTGASGHSWRALMPVLAESHRVFSIDLPGQGFTDTLRQDPTVPNKSRAVADLLKALDVENPILIGHSAGAAIALAVVLDGYFKHSPIISINGALYPFPGAASAVFPFLAKALFLNPVVPHMFALGATGRHRVERLLKGTGSKLDDEGLMLYQTLFKNPNHVRSTLSWMANWNLEALGERMKKLDVPFLQIIGLEDETIAPGHAFETANRIKHAETIRLSGRGHLVHEEDPLPVADAIRTFLARVEPVDA